jgi:multisubunit Na+/H+ antiporter MnhB subunit
VSDVLLPVLHLAVTAAYAGFQWTVRGVVYPQFDQVPAGAFAAYERRHQQRISRVVGPLFAGQLVTTAWLLATRPSGALLAGAACLAAVLLLTALGAVPLHRRLTGGWDDAAFRRLLRVDALRVLAATAGTAAAVWVVLG